jgi:prephenate dehydrogenase
MTTYEIVTAQLPDKPGQLARLFDDIGEAGINVEEFALEHSPGQKVGLAGVSVLPSARAALERALTERGWHVVA